MTYLRNDPKTSISVYLWNDLKTSIISAQPHKENPLCLYLKREVGENSKPALEMVPCPNGILMKNDLVFDDCDRECRVKELFYDGSLQTAIAVIANFTDLG